MSQLTPGELASVISAVASMGQLFAVTIAAFVAYAQFSSFKKQQAHLRQTSCLESGMVTAEMLGEALSALRMAPNSFAITGREGGLFESGDAAYFKAVSKSFIGTYAQYENHFVALREFKARAVALGMSDELIDKIDNVLGLISELKTRLDAFCRQVEFASSVRNYPRERWDNIADSMLRLPNIEEDRSRLASRMQFSLDRLSQEIQNAMRGIML